jgi:hypothetical protein
MICLNSIIELIGRAAKWSVEKQDIFAAEFAQYCKRVGCAPTQFNLDALADEKHKEKEKDKSTKIK